jgi:hypothetical protein
MPTDCSENSPVLTLTAMTMLNELRAFEGGYEVIGMNLMGWRAYPIFDEFL